jgi:chain length determinant protein tyrosine kinase EpsG
MSAPYGYTRPAELSELEAATPLKPGAPGAPGDGPDRAIGDILAELRHLAPEQLRQIHHYSRKHNMRFGEAAIALKLASQDDVNFALARQFRYPYAPDERQPVSPELITLREPFGLRAEAFRALRSQISMRLDAPGEPRRALAVISPERGEGKSYCAANLAIVLAQLGGRTLLIDADMRAPRQHDIFGVPHHAGLSSILSGRTERQVVQRVPDVPSLYVLPVGVLPPNPQELVERAAFGLLMRELTNKFYHVVVDTPAASFGADASVIAARCGAALVVARKNATRVSWLQDLVDSFSGSPVKMAGVVVNEF